MVEQNSMPHIVVEHAESKRVVELSSLPDVLFEELSVWRCVGFRGAVQALLKPSTYRPVRSIDRRPSDTIPMLMQERAHAVAFLCRVAFLEIRKSKQTHEVRIVTNERLVPKKVRFKLIKCDFGIVERKMRV